MSSSDHLCSTSSRPIKVMVGTGPEARSFYVHEDKLKQHSEYFKAALSGEWQEAREREVCLAEDDVAAFDIFAGFVYSGKLTIANNDDVPSSATRSEAPPFRSRDLAHCWALADKLLATSLKDAVTDKLCQIAVDFEMYPTGMHRKMFEHSISPSGVKRLLVDFAVFAWDDEIFEQEKQWGHLCSAFLYDTTRRALSITQEERKGDDPWLSAGCKYHDHGEDTPCYKTMF